MEQEMKMNRHPHANCLTRDRLVVLAVAFLVMVPHTLWAQQKTEPATPRLVLPQTKNAANEKLDAEAKVLPTVPGSLEDVNNKLQALTQRVNALEIAFERRMARMEDAYQQLRHSTQKPQCSAGLQVSVDPVSGATDDCKPYECNQVEGLCRTSCRDTADCASGAVCNNYHCTFAR
ncbi:MAG TPA: hypothetical protein VK830_00240 [Xanthomonadales bacterium]|nr:hypothetical protein [Xanthomonadales bacterium]